MWSTDIASLPLLGSKFSNAQELDRNDMGATPETARHTSIVAPSQVSAVELQIGEPRLLTLFGETAAIPTVSEHDTALFKTLELGVPGADTSNTEVRWDDARKQLWVGVWCGKRPEALTLPLRFPIPELAWLRTFHLPGHAGQHAQAWVEGNRITVQVPAAQAGNVVPLRMRVAPEAQIAPSDTRFADGPAGLTTALRWLGIAICAALCLPVLLFSLLLLGFVLLPLLPFIGVGLIASTGGSPTAPPARPRLPSAAAAARPFQQAQAA